MSQMNRKAEPVGGRVMMNRSGWTKGKVFVLAAVVLIVLAVSAMALHRPAPAPVAEAVPMTLGHENVHVAAVERVLTGPVISGSLQPERHATLRAEVAGAVLSATVEPGDAVKAGQVLVRLDDAAITDAVVAARSRVHTAEDAAVVARRNVERMVSLEAAGAVATRDVENARTAALSAETQLADAKSALVQAEKQLGKTTIRAPFTGVVSERPAAAGDIVQMGTPLVTVVDPASMQLEASVPSEQLSLVRPGAVVEFRVSGYGDQTFEGTIERVSPVADPATRQVPIWVTIPNSAGRLLGGLYAEGRIAAEVRDGVAVPYGAVKVEPGTTAKPEPGTAFRLKNGRVEEVSVRLGLRDTRSELVEVLSGIAAGDTLLVGAAQTITPGTPVVVAPSTPNAVARR